MDNTRHSGLFTIPAWTSVTVIGVGGIGATAALGLAKIGFTVIKLHDFDHVEDVNCATQLHAPINVGVSKVQSAALDIEHFTGVEPILYFNKVRSSPHDVLPGATGAIDADIIISAVDSIQARKDIWEIVKYSSPLYYIDARMGAEKFHAYIVTLKKDKWYSDMLSRQEDADIPDDPCTSKATFYTSLLAGGHVVELAKRLAMGDDCPTQLIHDIKEHSIQTL